MMDLLLISLLSILVTEYGFQTRKRAVERFLDGWRWQRTVGRMIWIGSAFAIGYVRFGLAATWLVSLAATLLVTEISSLVLRRRIRGEMRGNDPLSRPLTHLIPFLLASLPALVVFVAGFWTPDLIPDFFPKPLVVILTVATGFVATFCWSTMITVSAIGLVRVGDIAEEIEPHLGAGEVIGVLERLFTFAIILAGGLAAVGFAVAAKAAARYPQFKNPDFAEYFLIGTLASIGSATVIALMIKALLFP